MTDATDHHCWLQRLPDDRQLRSDFLRTTHETLARGGTSCHSGQGRTLYLEIQRLEAAGVPYTLRARPGEGYVVEVGDRT
jgi:hypothetical protein